ncbi:MAG: hypothetical protein IPH54_22465 [Rhodoferax sp.]|nr:hypothetical protein [Rhodoferax sp.]
MKDLDYLGWEPVSIRVKCNGWSRKIALYSWSTKAKQAAYTMRHGVTMQANDTDRARDALYLDTFRPAP